MNIPLWIDSHLVLDARKAVWLPQERTIVVADLLLSAPFPKGEDETVARLLSVIADYQPERVALIGQLLQNQGGEEGEEAEAALQVRVKALLEAIRERAALVIVGDETDPVLTAFLERCGWHAEVLPAWRAGKTLLLEGGREESPLAFTLFQEIAAVNGRVLLGGENPHLLFRGVKTPAFLLGENVTLLPAFATVDEEKVDLFEEEGFRTEIAKRACFRQGIALSDGKLIPVRK